MEDDVISVLQRNVYVFISLLLVFFNQSYFFKLKCLRIYLVDGVAKLK